MLASTAGKDLNTALGTGLDSLSDLELNHSFEERLEKMKFIG